MPSERYPAWMLRFNRAITSRPFTYFAAAMFVLDGLSRLVGGWEVRGVADIAVAAGLVAMRQRTRKAALGESESAERRAGLMADHPVAGALLAGVAWGAAMSVLLIVTNEGSIALAVGLGVGSGVLFFGPGVALLSRRYRNRRGW